MLIDKREIERVKRANELVAFIRRRGVTLTQRGKQFVDLCPFHDDHEPSLVVDARKQLWNCLGACHEGGDVYRFVMKADGVDFREAHRCSLLNRDDQPSRPPLHRSESRTRAQLAVNTVSKVGFAESRKRNDP
jgi:CHC2-type zinc finger protein